MIAIAPLTEIQIGHRAFHVATAKSGHIVAVSREGAGSFISPDLNSVATFDVHFELRHVSIAPDGGLVAITGGNDIAVISTPTLKIVHQLSECFESSCFGSDGLLWTCTKWDSETEVLEVWETATWTRLAREDVRDPYGDSHFWLLPHPNNDSVIAWAAAGQVGQWLFWARFDGRTITAELFPEVSDAALPSFSPTGDEFLVVSLNELHRYAYPQGPLRARMQWPNEYKRDTMGDFVYYVDDDLALLSSNMGRLFLVDVETMSIEDEIAIQGHDPKPIGKQDPVLGSDLSLWLPLPPDRFLSVHSDAGAHPDHRRDVLLTWQVP